jgi:hypothetical protein
MSCNGTIRVPINNVRSVLNNIRRRYRRENKTASCRTVWDLETTAFPRRYLFRDRSRRNTIRSAKSRAPTQQQHVFVRRAWCCGLREKRTAATRTHATICFVPKKFPTTSEQIYAHRRRSYCNTLIVQPRVCRGWNIIIEKKKKKYRQN